MGQLICTQTMCAMALANSEGFATDSARTKDFRIDVYRLDIDRQGRVDQVQVPMMGLCANEIASMHPKFVEAWEAIMCEILPPGRGE